MDPVRYLLQTNSTLRDRINPHRLAQTKVVYRLFELRFQRFGLSRFDYARQVYRQGDIVGGLELGKHGYPNAVPDL